MIEMDIPAIGIGTWKFQEADCMESVYNALKTGYRHIDCAFAYGNQDFIGKAIKQFLTENTSVKRSDIFVTSKLWNSQQFDVEAACRGCLKELGTDYLDLYLVHWPICYEPNNTSTDWVSVKKNPEMLKDCKYPKDPKTGLLREKEFTMEHLAQVWTEMEKLVQKGLVKRIGVSNFNMNLLQQLLVISKIKPYCNQIECHPYLKQKEIRAFMNKERIKFVSFSPLGGGNTDIMANLKIKKAAEKLGCTPCQFILAWNMAQGNIVIPRAKEFQYLKENFDSQNYIQRIKDDKDLFDIQLGNEVRTYAPLANSDKGVVERNENFKF
eukprot:GAHX01000745.1.p1 GENE.GAHX01000745.1~~GAHX01000745.1.p1  ORF type:complete len:334 (+),score=60.51 GAHX01000745.1:31-1002(+)